jgi:hypothetical protein
MNVRRSAILLACGLLAGPAAGEISIAGWTTNDQQVYGPALLRICNDTVYGIHIVWKNEESSPRYNFLPRGAGTWRWPGGTAVIPVRVSLGNMDLNPVDHVPYISAFFLDNHRYRATCVFDLGPGLGDFRWFTLDWRTDVKWNLGSISYDGGRQFAELRDESLGGHRTFAGGCLGRVGWFPSHNLCASKVNGMLAVFWTRNDGVNDGDLYLRQSTNNGYYWRDTTVPSRSIPDSWRDTYLGAAGVHDHLGNLHILANTYDGNNREAAAIWHYSPANSPPWSLVTRFQPGALSGRVATEALVCGRPSICERAATGELAAVWEQFDPLNVEPATGFLRADIWSAKSTDQGRTWGLPLRLTEPDQTSKRYPSVAALADSNLHLTFLIDSVAGAWAKGQGRATGNPVAYLRVPVEQLPVAVAEPEPLPAATPPELSVQPAILRPGEPALISSQLPATVPFRLVISDAAGRTLAVRTGRGPVRLAWCGKAGVYFCRLSVSSGVLTRKLVVH